MYATMEDQTVLKIRVIKVRLHNMFHDLKPYHSLEHAELRLSKFDVFMKIFILLRKNDWKRVNNLKT